MSKIRTGVFGGSFNPIHIGHLMLANYLCEYGGLDEIWFLVSPRNPLKAQTELWDDHLRFEWVRLAVAGYSRFRASNIEFHLPRPSYTVDTLCLLRNTHPDRTFTLVVGADNWTLFPRWYRATEILAHHDVLVYPRAGYFVDTSSLPVSVRLVDAPLLEISSTFIRRALAEGRDIRYFLPPAVYERLHAKGDRSAESIVHQDIP